MNNLLTVNGYNPLFEDSVELPPRLLVLMYGGEFLTNFNINLAVICIPIIAGIALLIIGKSSDNKKLRTWSYKSMK